MSTLKAACADGFYHPPDWDPRKGSRAELAAKRLGEPAWKAHPLRERAKKLDEGILTVRFEMPFHVRCTGCDNRIGKGVRFNAEKQCVGRYLSTKIWSFKMGCAVEDGTWRTDRKRHPHHIEVRTDPQAGDYVVFSGATRVGDLDQVAGAVVPTAEERGVERLPDAELKARRAADPFVDLEHAPSAQLEVRGAYLCVCVCASLAGVAQFASLPSSISLRGALSMPLAEDGHAALRATDDTNKPPSG